MLDLSNIQDRTTLRVDALRASYLLGDTPKPQRAKAKIKSKIKSW